MDAIPSAHLRQQKLEHQRQLIEQKQKQKRQAVGIRQFTSISTHQSLCNIKRYINHNNVTN